MSGIVAIVGRPNVGKSTLFNRLTKTRQALVDDLPGVTRDRLYGTVQTHQRSFSLVDTGGFDPPADMAFANQVHAQIELAMEEADVILFLTDGKAGLNPSDYEVANRLRKAEKPVILAVNKVDGPAAEDAAAEFYGLGMEPIHFISSAHGRGVPDLVDEIEALLPDELADEGDESNRVRVTILGRPNVGKSSMLNALVGAERVVVSDVPGTTRDAVDTPLEFEGKNYMLMDTAGIRRQGRVGRGLEKAGVFRALRTLERAHVGLVVVDSVEGITDGDLRVAGQVVEAHRCLILVLNKMDLLKGEQRIERLRQAKDALRFAPWAPVIQTSAKTGKGVSKILPLADEVFAEYNTRLATGPLNQALTRMVERHQPAMVKGRRPKFYYASQVSTRPPTVVIFTSRPDAVHFSYRRYLYNELRAALGLGQTPLRLILRQRKSKKDK